MCMYVLEWHIRVDMSMDMSMVVCKNPHSFACEQCLYNMWMEGKEGEGIGGEQIFAVFVAVPRTVHGHLMDIVRRRRLRSSVFWMTRMGLQYIFWNWAKWFFFFLVWLMNQRIYLLEFFFYCYWWKLKKELFFLEKCVAASIYTYMVWNCVNNAVRRFLGLIISERFSNLELIFKFKWHEAWRSTILIS